MKNRNGVGCLLLFFYLDVSSVLTYFILYYWNYLSKAFSLKVCHKPSSLHTLFLDRASGTNPSQLISSPRQLVSLEVETEFTNKTFSMKENSELVTGRIRHWPTNQSQMLRLYSAGVMVRIQNHPDHLRNPIFDSDFPWPSSWFEWRPEGSHRIMLDIQASSLSKTLLIKISLSVHLICKHLYDHLIMSENYVNESQEWFGPVMWAYTQPSRSITLIWNRLPVVIATDVLEVISLLHHNL